MAKKRLYSEKEFNTILKRAVEQQSDQGVKETVGLSLEEMQHIAGEVGLDPAVIAQIAADLDRSPDSGKRYPLYKTPTKIEVERILPGVIDEDQWPEIVAAIERELDVSGTSTQIGQMLEWTYSTSSNRYKITFSPGEDKTKVRFYGSVKQVVVAWYSVVMIYAIGFSSAYLSQGGNIALGGLAVLLIYLMVRFGLMRYANKKEQKFHGLIAQFEEAFTDVTHPESIKSTTSASQIEIPNKQEDQDQANSTAARKKAKG